MKKHLKEVDDVVARLGRESKPQRWLAKNYVGAGRSTIEFRDIRLPELRNAYKKGFSFSKNPRVEQWPFWDHVMRTSNVFETMLFPYFFAEKAKIDELHAHRKIVVGWLDRVDNWAHSDSLSSILVRLVEHDPKFMLPYIEKWSRSKNPWARRQSLVSLLYYSRGRQKVLPLKTILGLIDRQMDHTDYYVQKGVGWALRECYNVYPEETFAFLKDRVRTLSPGAWQAATEKLSGVRKSQLKSLRKGSLPVVNPLKS